MSRRLFVVGVAAALVVAAGAAPAQAQSPPIVTAFDLPAGFQPEGIAIGKSPLAYLGSRADGDIYQANLISGRGVVISQGPGTPSQGMKIDEYGRLFVAGGLGGNARVIDSDSGEVLKSYTLQTVPSLINDVVLTGGAAFYTDSRNPTLFQLGLGADGALPSAAAAIPLTGDLVYEVGNNANGIARTPDGQNLIIVQTNTGMLFHTTYGGVTTRIDLGGELVPQGDGLWLRGNDLYVVQNRLNLIAKIELNDTGTQGRLISRTGSETFDVPTTIAEYGGRFYLPNGRFTTPPTTTTPYNVVSIPIP